MSLGELWRRIRFLFEGDRAERELEEEMRLHADLRTARLRQEGASTEEAESVARRQFGNRTLLKENAREVWLFTRLDNFWREMRLAARALWRAPGFTITALLTIGLGIGANTAVFSLVDATLLRGLPYPNPERLGAVVVEFKGPGMQGTFSDQDGRTWELLRDRADKIDCAVYSDAINQANFAVPGRIGYVKQQRISAGYFRVMGLPLFLGREFTRTEDVAGGPPVAILSYVAWRSMFRGNRAVIGRKIFLRGESYTVVGVASPDFHNGGEAGVWTPLHPSTKGEGANRNYAVVARVRPGMSWQQATAQVEVIGAERIKEEHDIPHNFHLRIVLLPLQQMVAADVRTPMLLLWCAVGVVLLIGCINIAGLLIARGTRRSRELGTRMALGGGRIQVMYQLLIESLVLALAAGVFGLAIGWAGIVAARAVARESLGLWQAIALDHRVLFLSAAVTLLTSLLFGLWPAIQASRIDIRTALVEGGNRGVAGLRTLWPRRLLIAGEVALGVMLLVASSFVVQSFLYLRNQPLGFDPHQVLAASLPLQDVRYQTNAKINHLFDDALLRIRSLPGVEGAAAAMSLPYERGLNTGVSVRGRRGDEDTVMTYVTPDYFRTLKIDILQGRAFTAHDTMHSPRVTIVNTLLAKKLFGTEHVVGREVINGGSSVQIVGVVPNVPMKGSLAGYAPLTAIPLMYVPAPQIPDGFYQLLNTWFTPSFVVRSRAVSSETIAGMRKAMAVIDPSLPLAEFHGILDIRAGALGQQRFQAGVMSAMALLALLLAAVGIYGLISYTVVERTRELGIRIALGATIRQAVQSVAIPGFLLACAGAVVGIAASIELVPLLRHILWGIKTTDIRTFAGTIAILLAIAAVAILIPALRIVRLNPSETLREQ